MIHKIKLLRGYVSKNGQPVYECECREIIEAWSLREAQQKHQKILKQLKEQDKNEQQ